MADSAREIENLLYIYAERIDGGDMAGVAELFSHGRILDEEGNVLAAGTDEVHGMYTSTVQVYDDTGTPKTKHVTTNFILEELDEDAGAARGRSYYTVFQAVAGSLPLQPIISGGYRDTFQRIDGRWWFGDRVMIVTLVGDLSQHLTYELGG